MMLPMLQAICEAVTRPNMHFVPIKSTEQQAILSLHRIRQGYVKARTAQANQIRGLLAEFGLEIPQGIGYISKRVPDIIEDASNELPGILRVEIQSLLEHLNELDTRADNCEKKIVAWHKQSETSKKLEAIPGIGPLTATALIASIGDAKNFKNGRQVAAWIGLVPRQHSSGGKQNLLGISKRGDVYLRTLLIHGARAVIHHSAKKENLTDSQKWVNQLAERRNKNVAAVALANKNARIVWALLNHNRDYQDNHKMLVAA
jgi:transposase